jgi:hypothetical protein
MILEFLVLVLVLMGLGLFVALRMVGAGQYPDKLPAPPKVPHDMAVLDHELRELERAGL